jgi:hypothetical protein
MCKEVIDINRPRATGVVFVIRDVKNDFGLGAQNGKGAFKRTPPNGKKSR